METKIKDFKFILKHADIKSLLDIKALFGEFSLEVFKKLFDNAEKVYVLKDKTPLAVFFLVKTDKEYNLFSIITPFAYKDKDKTIKQIQKITEKAKVKTIVYNSNKTLYNLLIEAGFCFEKKTKEGAENRVFSLMSRG